MRQYSLSAPLALACAVLPIFGPIAGLAQATDNQPHLNVKPVTQSAPAVPTASSHPEPVTLALHVVDKHDKPDGSLKVSDLTLELDGKPLPVQSLVPESGHQARIGILIETSRTQQAALADIRSAAGKFVDHVLAKSENQSAAQLFLIHYDNQVELLQDFTPAPGKIHRELDDMRVAQPPREHHSSPSEEGSESGPPDDGGDQDERSRRRGGGLLYDSIFLSSDELMSKIASQPLMQRVLVVVAGGEDSDSKTSLDAALDAAEKAFTPVYVIYVHGEHAAENGNGNHGNSGGQRGGMGGSMPGGGWPGNSGGGGGWPGGGGNRNPGGRGRPTNTDDAVRKTLAQIAKRTGGSYFEVNKKLSIDDAFTQVAEMLKDQYFVTFTPAGDSDRDFHRVALKPKDDKWTVVAPEGYFPPVSTAPQAPAAK